MSVAGSCLCGDVAFETAGPPSPSRLAVLPRSDALTLMEKATPSSRCLRFPWRHARAATRRIEEFTDSVARDPRWHPADGAWAVEAVPRSRRRRSARRRAPPAFAQSPAKTCPLRSRTSVTRGLSPPSTVPNARGVARSRGGLVGGGTSLIAWRRARRSAWPHASPASLHRTCRARLGDVGTVARALHLRQRGAWPARGHTMVRRRRSERFAKDGQDGPGGGSSHNGG